MVVEGKSLDDKKVNYYNGGSKISQMGGGGAPTPGGRHQPIIWRFFAKKGMETKTFGPKRRGGGVRSHHP